jgi:hypothetical protein
MDPRVRGDDGSSDRLHETLMKPAANNRAESCRIVALVTTQAAQHCGITRAMRCAARLPLSKRASIPKGILQPSGKVIFLPHWINIIFVR